MKILIYYFTILFVLTNSASAFFNKNHNHSEDMNSPKLSNKEKVKNANCEDKINIDVNGLVCDFCARAVEKVFSKKDEVSAIDVDLDEGKITLAMQNNKSIDDATLTKLITDSGYNVVDIKKGCDE